MKNDDCKRIANNIEIKVDNVISNVIILTLIYKNKDLKEDDIRLLVEKHIKADREYMDFKSELFSLGKEL